VWRRKRPETAQGEYEERGRDKPGGYVAVWLKVNQEGGLPKYPREMNAKDGKKSQEMEGRPILNEHGEKKSGFSGVLVR